MSSVESALETINHRGPEGTRVVKHNGAALGQVWPEARDHMMEGEDDAATVLDGEIYNWYDVQPGATSPLGALELAYAEQGPSFIERLDGHFALAIAGSDGVFLARDPVGVVPLYYSSNGWLAFASEVKAMQDLGGTPTELPPGHYLDPVGGLVQYAEIAPVDPVDAPVDDLVTELRHTLVTAIAKRTGSGDGTARLWGAETGKAVHVLKVAHYGLHGASGVAFSPDGGHFASGGGSDDMVKLWDMETGGSLRTFRGHRKIRGCLAFSADGRQLASADQDGNIRLWDIETRETVQELAGHATSVASLAFSRDGTRLASGAKDVRIWDAATGRSLHTFELESACSMVALSLDGKRLTAVSWPG